MPEFGERAGPGADSHCYRHPQRESFVLCQRCARTVCGECQTPAPVGVICPECMAAARRSTAVSRPSVGTRIRRASAAGAPVVTYAIIGVTALVFVAQWLTQDAVTNALMFSPAYLLLGAAVPFEPWRAFTLTLVHGGLWHIGFNMLTLWLFGRVLEPLYGRLRFALVWVAAALGGSLAVTLSNDFGWVVGASGAVFGLFGAYFIVMRQARMNTTSLLVLIGINVVLGFVLPGIAWEAHLGGLAAGVVAGWFVSRDLRGARRDAGTGAIVRPVTGAVLVGGLAVVLLVAAVAWANIVASTFLASGSFA